MNNRNFFSARSLSIKILLLIFIGYCIVFGAGWFYFKFHFAKEIESQVKQRAEIIANSIDQFAWINGASPSLQRLVTSIGGEKNIGFITIIRRDENFSLIATGGNKEFSINTKPEELANTFENPGILIEVIKSGGTISGIYKNLEDNDYDYVYVTPTQLKVSADGKIVQGSIYVQIEIQNQMQHINDDMLKVTLGFLAGLMILISLQYTVLQYYVFKPINNIKSTMRLRSQGNMSAYASGLHDDEIGEVGKALNTMLDKLEERKRELIRQKNLLNTVIENIPLSLFAKSVKDNYSWVIWNKKAQETFDLTQEQVLGKIDHDIFPKKEADFFHETDLKVIEGRKVINIPEEPVTTKRGTWPAHTIKVPVYDESGTPVLLMGILEDISEQKAREAELEKAKNSAISANRLKSEFLSNISHELRTPMHSIITFSRQGIERIQKWSLSEHEENLKLINSSGSRLLLLLNDLLDLSKLEAGAVKYNFRKNDINPIIQMAVNSLRSLAGEKNLTVEYMNANISIAAMFDSEKITQVIINLLSNAIKFTPKDSRIEIETSPEDEFAGSIRISISDSGMGIPEDELESVFDKFVQSSKTKTGAGGTGLGLAICKEIVGGHGGKIWAENNPSGGARFCVLLPVNQKKGIKK